MKIKTSELTGAALDWAVAMCEGLTLHHDALLGGVRMEGWYASGYYVDTNRWIHLSQLCYSSDWNKCGPIMEQQKIWWSDNGDATSDQDIWWCLSTVDPVTRTPQGLDEQAEGLGPTLPVAAMRCYVASKMGNEIEIPDGLQGE